MNLMRRFGPNTKNFRMQHTDPMVTSAMSRQIISWLPANACEYVVIFIGTDRSTGDALGPLAGSYFSAMKPRHMTVYGTLHEPVHATNLAYCLQEIEQTHRQPFVIAVDACLGKTTSVGHLIAGVGPVKPGAALNKPLPSVGDVHITGVVNVSGFMEHSVLQNTRLSVVMDMAEKISGVLEQVDLSLKYKVKLHSVGDGPFLPH